MSGAHLDEELGRDQAVRIQARRERSVGYLKADRLVEGFGRHVELSSVGLSRHLDP